MARDTHITRPDRAARHPRPEATVLTRQERIALLVHSILPQVRVALETPRPKSPFKRKT